MDYATAYDVGDRKRDSAINEDSVALCVFADGHRDGLVRHRSVGSTPGFEGAAGSGPEASSPGGLDDGDGADGDDASGGDGDVTDLASLLASDDEDAASEDGSLAFGDRHDVGESQVGDDGDGVGRPGAGATGEVAVSGSDQHPDSRHVAVFALADGAGGYDAGDVASYIASTVVVEELAPLAVRAARSDPAAFGVDLAEPLPATPTTAEIQGAIVDAIHEAHRQILRYADAAGQPAFTTIVAGVAVGGELHYGWAGDSRAYVLNETTGRIEQLTRDHSVVADLAEAGTVDEVEALVHPRGNEITAALGGHPGEEIEASTVGVETHAVPLWGDDVFLVTSDGLLDAQTDAPRLHDEYVAAEGSEDVRRRIREVVVTDDELRDTVLAAPSLGDAAEDLLSLANDRGGKDNLSVILFRDPARPLAPSADAMPTRAIDPDEPVEERQTVILTDE